jgi:putative transposase
VTRLNRGTFRYRSHKDPRTALRMRIREIAQTGVRYGYRKIRVLLNREGWKVGKYLAEPLSGRGINAAPATETPASTG